MNAASAENGASILVATSSDERYPASNMIDGKDGTFWMTTGLFPQEFVLAFPTPTNVQGVKLRSKFIRSITITHCDEARPNPDAFQPMFSADIEAAPADFQMTGFECDTVVTTRYVKVTLEAGHHDFVSIYTIEVDAQQH